MRALCASLAHLATRQVPSGQKSVFVQLGVAVLLRLVQVTATEEAVSKYTL